MRYSKHFVHISVRRKADTDMKRTTIKHNKNGSLTVYVPKDQTEVFNWVISEGLAGLGGVENLQDLGLSKNVKDWRGVEEK